MEFDEVIKTRKSVRSFSKKQPSWKDIIEAVDSACKGPFVDERNHLKFIIIEEDKKIEKVAENCNQLWINQSQLVVVVVSDDTNLENRHGDRGRIFSRQQAGAAIVTFMLKLTDIGLSSCWVGAYSDERIKQMLNIPDHLQIEAIIPIGYEKVKSKKVEKKDVEHAIFWDVWGKRKRDSYSQDPHDRYGLN
jgi:nitroreductase